MSNGNLWWQSESFRLTAVTCLIVIGEVSHLSGEFLRDAAVLLFVFVPLDWWRPLQGSPFNWLGLAELVAFFFVFGVALEFLSLLAKRFKRDLEGNHGSSGVRPTS